MLLDPTLHLVQLFVTPIELKRKKSCLFKGIIIKIGKNTWLFIILYFWKKLKWNCHSILLYFSFNVTLNLLSIFQKNCSKSAIFFKRLEQNILFILLYFNLQILKLEVFGFFSQFYQSWEIFYQTKENIYWWLYSLLSHHIIEVFYHEILSFFYQVFHI